MKKLTQLRETAGALYISGRVLDAFNTYGKLIKNPHYRKKVSLKDRLNDMQAVVTMLHYLGRNDEALEYAKAAAKLAPDNWKMLLSLSRSFLFVKDIDQSINYANQVVQIKPDEFGVYDILAEAYMLARKYDSSIASGILSLGLKERLVANYQALPLPAQKPADFDPLDKSKHIISFSLFGDSPKYCEIAIINAQLAATIYPAWRCRFYCDNQVPESVVSKLKLAMAQVILMPETLDMKDKLFWRFLVMGDTSIDRYIVRDCDSVINSKESAAVTEWVESGQRFHIMRDFYTHADLILAGMFGGTTDVFPQIENMIASFQLKAHSSRTHLDQLFLRELIWPTIKNDVLIHDRYFRYGDTKPFPEHPAQPEDHHIGMNEGAAEINVKLQTSQEGQPVNWRIHNTKNELICHYQTIVKNGAWSSQIPTAYVEKIHSKEYFLKYDLV